MVKRIPIVNMREVPGSNPGWNSFFVLHFELSLLTSIYDNVKLNVSQSWLNLEKKYIYQKYMFLSVLFEKNKKKIIFPSSINYIASHVYSTNLC